MDHAGLAMTCKVGIVRRFLDEHLHKIIRRYFFLDPIPTGSMDSPQFLFNGIQGGLGEHAQVNVNLRLVVSMPAVRLSLLNSDRFELV
jgi:hypothetical protein